MVGDTGKFALTVPGLHIFRHSALALAILRLVLLVSAIVFIIATSVGVIKERARALNAAHELAYATVLHELKSVSVVLWNYDQPGWNNLLEGMTQTPSIARVELFDTNGLVADVHSADPERRVDSVWELTIVSPDKKSEIGRLRVSESWSVVNKQIMSLVGTLVLTELVKIAGLSLAILFIVYWLVARHLDQLSKDVVRLKPDDLDAQLQLLRESHPAQGGDELDILVNAINGFLRARAEESRRREKVELELKAAEARSRELLLQTQQVLAENKTILNNAVIGIVYLKNRIVISCNSRFEEIFCYDSGELVGCSTECLYDSRDTFEKIGERAYAAVSIGESFTSEVKLKHKDGSIFWGHLSGRAIDPTQPQDGSIWVYSDISDRKAAEEKINHLAFYDQLTGLPNRTLLLNRMRQTVASNRRSAEHAALLFVDLDRFKLVNDTLGHDIGDHLLKQVSERMLTCVRAEDTVARFGGDEYIVMLTGLSAIERVAAQQARNVGEKILSKLRQAYQMDSGEYLITPSIGVTIFGADLADIDALLVQADMAMYRMKEDGRNGLRFFDPEMENEILRRAAMEVDLRNAIEQKDFILHYQPQMNDTTLVGVEALVRWVHPKRGMVFPNDFIPLAEQTGLIVGLGNWVLEEACRQLTIWQSRPYLQHVTIAVNVSVHQFRQADFVQQVQGVLERTGADSRLLKIELTESLFADDVDLIIEKMETLKHQGVSFSLDDFGTGFSSLSYLKRFPLDQLKIDKSFVRDVLEDPNDAAIVKTIIALANSLGLKVIAEGVETEAQRDFIAQAGCQMYQGYLFSRPLAVESFEAFALTVPSIE